MKLDKYFDLIDSIEFAHDKNYKRLMDGVRQHVSRNSDDMLSLIQHTILMASRQSGHEKNSSLIID